MISVIKFPNIPENPFQQKKKKSGMVGIQDDFAMMDNTL